MIPHRRPRRPAARAGFAPLAARWAVLAGAAWLLSTSAAASAAEAPIEIGGRVVADGRPVAGAVVELQPYEDRFSAALRRIAGDPVPVAARAESGEDGRFALAAPEAGMWLLVVSRDGFVPMRARLAPLVEPQDLRDAPLERDVGLTVRVADEDGRAVPGARVRVVEEFFEPFRRPAPGWDVALRQGVADERGRLRLARRAGEGLELAAWAPGRLEAAARVEPGAGGEVTIVLPAGVERRLAVRRGDEPAAGVVVRVGQAGWPAAVTGEDGTATLHVAKDGSARIEIAAGGGWRAPAADVPPAPAAAAGAPGPLADAAPAAPAPLPPLALELPATWLASGVVAAARTGEPIAGALVWPRGDAADVVRTDGRGRFRLVRVEREEVEVGAAAPGFVSGERTISPAEREVSRLALEPNAAVAGVVVDAAGQPVARAELWLRGDEGNWLPWASEGMGRDTTRARTWSDETGRFRFGGFAPGRRLELRASAPGFAPLFERVETGGPPLRLVLAEGRRVSGRLVSEEGEPVAGVRVGLAWLPEARPLTVVIDDGRRVFDHEATSDAEGRFVIADLPAGAYDAAIDGRPTWALRELPGVRVPADRGIDLGEVTLQPAVALDLLVVDQRREPVAGARVSRVFSTDGRRVQSVVSRGNGAETRTDDEGRLRLPGLAPGEPVDLDVRHESYRPERLLAVVPPLEDELVVVLERGLTLHGRVVASDGTPAARADLSLVQEWEMAHSGGSTSQISTYGLAVDENGAFTSGVLEPSRRLELSATWRGERGSLTLTDLPDRGEIGPLEVRLQPAPRLAGTVSLPDGAPAAGAQVTLRQGESDRHLPPDQVATADPLGRFDLVARAPGPAQVEATLDDLSAASEVVLVPGTTEVALRLDVPDTPGVSGRVVDAKGRPVPGAHVQAACVEGCGGSTGRSADEAGEFVIRDLQPARYRLSAGVAGLVAAEREVDLSGGWVGGVELVLRPGGAVEGTLTGVESGDLPGIAVTATPVAGGRVLDGLVDHRGGYRVEGLTPGAWRIAARSETTGRSAEGEVDLLAADETARLDLELGETGVRLSGVATLDGRPRADLRLQLRREDPSGSVSIAHTRTAFDGSFRFAGVEPGRYVLAVQPQIDVPPSSRIVDLVTDQEIRLDLTVAVVEGRVLAAAGAPAAGLRAVLADPQGGELYADVAPDGRFHFPAVAPGPYLLTARRGDTDLASPQPIQVDAQDVTGLVVVVDVAQ